MPPLIESGLSTLLSDIIIEDNSKAISILKEHFTFRADEITKGYQDSYGYAITAITVGLAAPDQKILHSKITRDFADPIEINYLQPFAQQRGIPSDALSSLRQQFIEQLNQLIKHKDQLFQIQQFTQADLAALINYQGTITQLVLEQIQQFAPVPETLAAFLSQEDLLGKAILYFFHEIIRSDERQCAHTQAALQQQTQSAWQTRSQLLSELMAQFSVWYEQERKRQAEIKTKKEQKRAHWSTDTEKKITTDGHFFEFETVTVNAKGKITHRERKQARYQTEDLGKGVILEMVYIPGGTFMMGSPETEEGRWSNGREEPQHKVTIEPFYISKYPVTQAQWEAVMGNNPSYFKGDNRPVEMVSYDEAVAFCQRLSEKTSKSYGLPSEAQWEYSCRAGTTTPFYFGETITTDLANCYGDSTYGSGSKGVYRKQTTDVGSFPPNAFGLYDMHGNVWEWCAEPWHDNYEGAPSDGRVWKEKEKEKGFFAKCFGWKKEGKSNRLSLRGGSWDGVAAWMRSANRGDGRPAFRFDDVGLRVAWL
ncbi:MAG: formylglycine-generating enzyme family protein [Pseudomonadota bacterium]